MTADMSAAGHQQNGYSYPKLVRLRKRGLLDRNCQQESLQRKGCRRKTRATRLWQKQTPAERAFRLSGGKRGIRTLVTGKPVNRISNPAHSTTLPSFRCFLRLSSGCGHGLGQPWIVAFFWSRDAGSGAQFACAAHVGAQYRRYFHAAVGALVVFEYRDQGAAYGQAAAV